MCQSLGGGESNSTWIELFLESNILSLFQFGSTLGVLKKNAVVESKYQIGRVLPARICPANQITFMIRLVRL